MTATEVRQITEQVSIFDKDKFAKELEKLDSVASRADTIAHRTAKTITKRMEEDKAYYEPLSRMIKQAIDALHQKRITAAGYLERAIQAMEKVVDRTGDDFTEALQHNEEARPYYGLARDIVGSSIDENGEIEAIAAEIGPSASYHFKEQRTRSLVRS